MAGSRHDTLRSLWLLMGWAGLFIGAFGGPVRAGTVSIKAVPGQAELGFIEIHGAAAGEFDPALWRAGKLHFLHDVRSPLLTPRVSGVYRNIYAPSTVEVPDGWRVFYGAWDGVPTGNDRIYSVLTRDFLDFADRATVIEHGVFIHVCNVNALRLANGAFRMVCTVYPDERDRNKPAVFESPDGKVWNGTPAPYPATRGDIVRVDGYGPYDDADINGVNVLLHEDGVYRLYFCDYRNRGQVYRASAKDGRQFRLDGPCLKSDNAVNDVKKLDAAGKNYYLMALHRNCDRLWYSLSNDGMRFEPDRELGVRLGDEDRYIVAVGWVTQGRRLLGYLYGAGAAPGLNRNRIFARWLQKKVVFVDREGKRYEPARSLGPDRQLIALPGAKEMDGRFEVLGEDGAARLGEPIPAKAVPGGVYQVALQ